MDKLYFLVLLVVSSALSACSGAKDTPVPKDIAKMEALKPAMEKLTPEERELLGGYLMRKSIGSAFGNITGKTEQTGIPDGMTIGKAIEEQRKFNADRAIEVAKEEALKAKLKAELEVAQAAMRDAVTVVLISKRIEEVRGVSGILMDENIEVAFGYKNNSAKDIAGVKGRIVVKDLFGDDLSAFQVSNDNTIKAGKGTVWQGSRSIKYNSSSNKDRKFVELSDDKFKVIWEPQAIVFTDGTKMETPNN